MVLANNEKNSFAIKQTFMLQWADQSFIMLKQLFENWNPADFSYTDIPRHTIFRFYDGVKVIHIQQIPNFRFWSFPELAICCRIFLWRWAGQWTTVTGEPHSHQSKQTKHNHPVPIQPFCCSVQDWINCMRQPTSYYKIAFVLDDFAQL